MKGFRKRREFAIFPPTSGHCGEKSNQSECSLFVVLCIEGPAQVWDFHIFPSFPSGHKTSKGNTQVLNCPSQRNPLTANYNLTLLQKLLVEDPPRVDVRPRNICLLGRY